MPQARDYGHADSSTLVPGSLTVYRHFLANEGRLLPMSYSPSRAAQGWPGSGAHRPYDCPPLRPDGSTPESEVYEAECAKLGPYIAWAKGDVSHQTPVKDCTCGFYAHYAPDTDFYPASRWGRSYARLSNQRQAEDSVILRAVCEVTGTTVMGRLGVRAQRMKILGLTIDWAKHIEPKPEMYARPGRLQDTILDAYDIPRRIVFDPILDAYRYELADDGGDERAYAIERMKVLAYRYGVEYYADADAMVEAHPPADIEALGVDVGPPEPPLPKGVYYASLINEAFNNSTPKPKRPKVKPVPNEQARRVIEAKRNREAPPGAGIDRRKRKL